jgi:hypothetical protein
MNRTQEEIVARIKWEKEWNDFLNFAIEDLIVYLDFVHAQHYLKAEVTEESWIKSSKDPKQEITDYMPFAWDKANNCRGLSAGRSIDHLRAWLWLAGEDEFLTRIPLTAFTYYGSSALSVSISALTGKLWTMEAGGTTKQRKESVRKRYLFRNLCP